jgi:hypothetical protein
MASLRGVAMPFNVASEPGETGDRTGRRTARRMTMRRDALDGLKRSLCVPLYVGTDSNHHDPFLALRDLSAWLWPDDDGLRFSFRLSESLLQHWRRDQITGVSVGFDGTFDVTGPVALLKRVDAVDHLLVCLAPAWPAWDTKSSFQYEE